MQHLEEIIKLLENVTRGKNVNEEKLLLLSRSLYDWTLHELPSFILSISDMDEDQRQRSVSSSIQLYNKARLLSTPSMMEAKIYLKAAAAWLLTVYGGSKFKSLVSCLKLHCRSAAELMQHFPDDVNGANRCLHQAMDNWNSLNNATLERTLSPVELEELRVYAFHAFIASSVLLMKNDCNVVKDIKAPVAGAMEIVQFIPSLRMTLVRHLVDIGFHFSKQELVIDALHYFQRAITIFDLIVSESPIASEIKEEQWRLKARACLSVGYIYNELNKMEKAICYISMAEGAGVLERDLTEFAKFSVHCKHGSVSDSFSMGLDVIRSTTSYTIAINVLTMFCEAYLDFDMRLDLYRALLESYPGDTEYNSTRTRFLQLTIVSFRQVEAATRESTLALSLAESLVDDNLTAKKPLDNFQLSMLRRIMEERVGWLRAARQWEHGLLWSDLLIEMTLKESPSKIELPRLWKADILFNLGRYEEALKISLDCAVLNYSASAVFIMFKAALRSRSTLEAAHIVVNTHRKHVMGSTAHHPEEYLSTKRIEDLRIFISCCRTAYHSQYEERHACVAELLEEWLNQCLSHRLWAVTKSHKGDREMPDPVVISVLCELLEVTFLNSTRKVASLSATSLKPSGISRRNGNLESDTEVNLLEISCDPIDETTASLSYAKTDGLHSEAENTMDPGPIASGSVSPGRKKRRLDSEECRPSKGKRHDSPYTDNGMEMSVENSGCSDSLSFQNDCKWVLLPQPEMWSSILMKIGDILTIFESEKGDRSLFGGDEDLQRLADLCWNIAKVLMLRDTRFADEKSLVAKHEPEVPTLRLRRLIWSATLFEHAALGYGLISSNLHGENYRNKVLCLLTATAQRLDYDSVFLSVDEAVVLSISAKEKDTNVSVTFENIRRVKSILSDDESSSLEIVSDPVLQKLLFMLEFSTRCRYPDLRNIDIFLQTNSKAMMELTSDELRTCSDICMSGRYGNSQIARNLLLLSVQKLIMKPLPDWATIGGLYNRIIKLSFSRQEALDTVIEFEQLLTGSQEGLPVEQERFCKSDVDEICITCCNWGMTLMELNQTVLAEMFISKSLQLLNYTSELMNKFHEMIQESYSKVVEAKSKTKDSDKYVLQMGQLSTSTAGLSRSNDSVSELLAKPEIVLSSRTI